MICRMKRVQVRHIVIVRLCIRDGLLSCNGVRLPWHEVDARASQDNDRIWMRVDMMFDWCHFCSSGQRAGVTKLLCESTVIPAVQDWARRKKESAYKSYRPGCSAISMSAVSPRFPSLDGPSKTCIKTSQWSVLDQLRRGNMQHLARCQRSNNRYALQLEITVTQSRSDASRPYIIYERCIVSARNHQSGETVHILSRVNFA
jgi:hypothetical protein